MIWNDASHRAAPEDDVTAVLAHNDKSKLFKGANGFRARNARKDRH